MEEMTRLFNLDFQLLHDTVLLAIAIFFLFLALSYLLFNPVRKMLKDRQEKIATDIDTALADKPRYSRVLSFHNRNVQESKQIHLPEN